MSIFEGYQQKRFEEYRREAMERAAQNAVGPIVNVEALSDEALRRMVAAGGVETTSTALDAIPERA